MRTPRKKGFTLIEMIVVIAIIGVLAAILVPAMIGYVRNARYRADVSSAKTIHNQVMALLIDVPDASTSFYSNNNGNYRVVETLEDGTTQTYNMMAIARMPGKKIATICRHGTGRAQTAASRSTSPMH